MASVAIPENQIGKKLAVNAIGGEAIRAKRTTNNGTEIVGIAIQVMDSLVGIQYAIPVATQKRAHERLPGTNGSYDSNFSHSIKLYYFPSAIKQMPKIIPNKAAHLSLLLRSL